MHNEPTERPRANTSPTAAAPPPANTPPRATRRLLLTLGAVTVVSACTRTPDATATWVRAHGRPPEFSDSPGSPGSPYATGSADGSASPSPSPSPWAVPLISPASSQGCAHVPGINQTGGGPQYYLPCSGTSIALTVDDGPDPVWTPQILALLDQYKIKATFCVVGRRAAQYPHLVAAAVAAGHHVANHTFSHPLSLPKLTNAQIAAEINHASQIIGETTGHAPTLFRAPGGNWSPAVVQLCTAAGMRPLGWSVDPRDWSRPGVPHIVETILRHTRPGSIILDHDGGGNRDQTIAALQIALPRLLDAGYQFVQP